MRTVLSAVACLFVIGASGASAQQAGDNLNETQRHGRQLLAQSCETTVAGLQFEPQILLPTRLRTVMLQTQVQFSLCLSGVNAGWYTAHEAQPGIFALLEPLPPETLVHLRHHLHGPPEIRTLAGLKSEKPSRCDADDGEGNIVQEDRLADYREIAAKPPLPKTVADDDHGLWIARLIIDGRKHSTAGRSNPQHGKEIAGDFLRMDEFRFSSTGARNNHPSFPISAGGQKTREAVVALLELFVEGKRKVISNTGRPDH